MAPAQVVTFLLQRPGMDAQPQFLAVLPRDALLLHSAAALRFFTLQPALQGVQNATITLKAGSIAGLRRVLNTIKALRPTDDLEINARDLDVFGKLAVWHAAKELQVRPEEAEHKIFRMVTWDLTHVKLTPRLMQTAWDILGPHRDDASDMYKKGLIAMAHQYVWDMLHGKFSEEEKYALQATYGPIPPLGMMIGDKQDELEPKKKHHGKQSEG